MQIISYSVVILKHFQINSQFRKILMLKSLIVIFGGTFGMPWWVHSAPKSVTHDCFEIRRIGVLFDRPSMEVLWAMKFYSDWCLSDNA